jgi:hypothetical protein
VWLVPQRCHFQHSAFCPLLLVVLVLYLLTRGKYRVTSVRGTRSGLEEDEAEERFLTRLGVSEDIISRVHGSEGFDRPPSDVYS